MTRRASIAMILLTVLIQSTLCAGGHDAIIFSIDSQYQARKTDVRVLLPAPLKAGVRYRTVYVLPVEPERQSRYGDGLAEVQKLDLHNKHGVIVVAPTFSALPWYCDHPTDPELRQESHLLKVVLPLVEETFPASTEPRDRLLLGFSKSGFGAWSLVLRHPDVFGRASAWDAPLMMHEPGKYGSGPIFGAPENFERYRIDRLLRAHAAALHDEPRLVLTGYGNFRAQHEQAHALLDELKIAHIYRDGPQRAHDWHSGWLAEAFELLVKIPVP